MNCSIGENVRNLNFRHLLYFWQVAKLGHLTRAAQLLRVSQSALSAQIRQLENYLGRPLFDRTGRTLVLTEFGTTVLDYADSIFGLGQELMALARGGDNQRVQQVRVGAVATLSRNFLENLLRPLLGKNMVSLRLESGSLDELLGRLQMHNLDVVLSNRPVVTEAGKPWRCMQIDQQSVCLVGRPRPRGRRFRVPADVDNARFVVPGPSSDIRSQFDLWCEKNHVQINIVAEVDDMAMLRLFGGGAEETDFHEAAGRADMRLGAWCWIAREAAFRVESLDDASCMIVALLGMYYLGSGI